MTPEYSPAKTPRLAKPISALPVVARRRWTSDEKERLLADFARSGQSASQFCRETGLCPPTFSAWRRCWARDAASAPLSPRFAAVRVDAPVSPDLLPQVAIHCPDGCTVVAAVGSDPRWLGELTRALR
jgi:transposase-like protein